MKNTTTICDNTLPSSPIIGDVVVMMNTGDYLIFNGTHWVTSTGKEHVDFQPSGKLSNNDQIRKYFPPEKKESFLNYVKLFHHENLSELLVQYSTQILKQPWPEAEEHLNDYWMEEYNEYNEYHHYNKE